MSPIRLLSTDFDGTLAGGSWGETCAPMLSEELAAVARGGGVWVVNTGRSLESALEGVSRLSAPVTPHYILTSERHIYKPHADGGWHDYGDWNRICREQHDLLFSRSGQFFENLKILTSGHDGISILENLSGVPEGLVAESEELLDGFILEMAALAGRPGEFHYQRSNVYLRFCHLRYDKGSSLAELSRLLDMPTSRILAIGDHQNDISMLFGKAAAMVACPSNSHPSVKETVTRAGGHVSGFEAGEGTADAIRLYRTGMKKPGRGL